MKANLGRAAASLLTVAALAAGSLFLAAPAHAAPAGKPAYSNTSKVRVAGHTDTFKIASTTSKFLIYKGTNLGYYNGYKVSIQNAKGKVLFADSYDGWKGVYFQTHINLANHFASDTALVSAMKKATHETEKVAKAYAFTMYHLK